RTDGARRSWTRSPRHRPIGAGPRASGGWALRPSRRRRRRSRRTRPDPTPRGCGPGRRRARGPRTPGPPAAASLRSHPWNDLAPLGRLDDGESERQRPQSLAAVDEGRLVPSEALDEIAQLAAIGRLPKRRRRDDGPAVVSRGLQDERRRRTAVVLEQTA